MRPLTSIYRMSVCLGLCPEARFAAQVFYWRYHLFTSQCGGGGGGILPSSSAASAAPSVPPLPHTAPGVMAAACVFLAAKVGEEVRRARDVINVAVATRTITDWEEEAEAGGGGEGIDYGEEEEEEPFDDGEKARGGGREGGGKDKDKYGRKRAYSISSNTSIGASHPPSQGDSLGILDDDDCDVVIVTEEDGMIPVLDTKGRRTVVDVVLITRASASFTTTLSGAGGRVIFGTKGGQKGTFIAGPSPPRRVRSVGSINKTWMNWKRQRPVQHPSKVRREGK